MWYRVVSTSRVPGVCNDPPNRAKTAVACCMCGTYILDGLDANQWKYHKLVPADDDESVVAGLAGLLEDYGWSGGSSVQVGDF